MFTPMGPGVDSLTASISASWGRVNQPVRHIVQKRQSGQAAAYGEQAGFEKFVKQLQIDHDRFAPRFLISSPATAAANT